MNRLTDKERKALMDDIRSFDEQMPCVGVFQYNPIGHRLVGVQKSEVTPKMVEDAAERGGLFIDYPQGESKFGAEEDYGGRVVWSIDKFLVLVSKWAEPFQRELTELMDKEFSLPYFEFVNDGYCDLGLGWSGNTQREFNLLDLLGIVDRKRK